jgi:hypothetical protein
MGDTGEHAFGAGPPDTRSADGLRDKASITVTVHSIASSASDPNGFGRAYPL